MMRIDPSHIDWADDNTPKIRVAQQTGVQRVVAPTSEQKMEPAKREATKIDLMKQEPSRNEPLRQDPSRHEQSDFLAQALQAH